ncbi:hypothetical protein ETU10_10570 [Apibacter muscae]|uniref:AbiTii domain-containing protein n=1 Tax=Apibacter muscae TaxID=2509004 RepID=UPI0011ACD3C4|nr:hypothetical protein [Apibacter muscae]TWP22510.1 hypothetical protein ETU10_10570 [Apibacter muscae]
MIKDLIKDLSSDNISISQALTRAKIIAYKINNNEFKTWINLELNGYKSNELPTYRKITCEVLAEISNPFHGTRTIPFDVSSLNEKLKENSFYEMNITQSIPTMEEGLRKDKDEVYGYEYLPIDLVQTLKQMSEDGHWVTAVKRRIQFSEIKHIIQITKQKLLDTLLELNDVFPNLENDFTNNAKNNELTRTIINHNIYGNHSNSNIAVGNNINQEINNKNNIKQFLDDIKKLGVEDDEIKEVKVILEKTSEKKELGKKLLNWVGKVSSKAIEKGIELQIPLLIEKVQELL